MYDFKLINPSEDDWKIIEGTYDNTVYKTKHWFDYLESINVQPFVCEVLKDGDKLGYFVGEKVKRVFNLIGAPIEGVGTAHQGLSMMKETPPEVRIGIYDELAQWVFIQRFAVWFQVEDYWISENDVAGKQVNYEPHDRNSIDLTQDEENLFRNMSQKSCRYMINKAKKMSIEIREATDPIAFLDLHYEQHLAIMRSKGLDALKPKEVFKKLIEKTWPNEMLLLEAVLSTGEIVGTGMYAVNHGSSCYYSAAFDKKFGVSPNELMNWEAIIRCKAKGAKFFDFNGVDHWKFKYGGVYYRQPRLVYTKYGWLVKARKTASDLYHKYRYQLVKIGI